MFTLENDQIIKELQSMGGKLFAPITLSEDSISDIQSNYHVVSYDKRYFDSEPNIDDFTLRLHEAYKVLYVLKDAYDNLEDGDTKYWVEECKSIAKYNTEEELREAYNEVEQLRANYDEERLTTMNWIDSFSPENFNLTYKSIQDSGMLVFKDSVADPKARGFKHDLPNGDFLLYICLREQRSVDYLIKFVKNKQLHTSKVRRKKHQTTTNQQ